MQHVTDGTLHALLDGELDSTELAEVRHHLEECAECAQRHDQAREFVVGADLLIESLDEPVTTAPFPPPDAVPVGGAESTILFPFPPENIPTSRRGFRWAPLAWVATIALAVGGGYYLSQMNRPAATEEPSGASGGGVVSEAERPAAPAANPATPQIIDSTGALAADSTEVAVQPSADTAADSAARPTQLADASRRQAPPPPAETRSSEAARTRRTNQPTSRPSPRAPAESQRAAAKATADQTLEPAAENSAPAGSGLPAAPAPAPASPEAALERRSDIYQRIGLDEAKRALGSPVHVIAGLRPQFIGLASADGIPAADPGRPVVRVVYLDAAQHLILLDQQRLPAGESAAGLPHSPAAANGPDGPMLRWVVGDVWLWLHGGLSPADLNDVGGRVH